MRGVIYNSKRKFGAASVYYPVDLYKVGGSKVPLLFTQGEIDRAAARAASNPEDVQESRRITMGRVAVAARATLLVIVALAALLILVSMVGCAKPDTIIKRPDPPLVTCAAVCRVSCAVVVPLWQPPDANAPEAFDYIRPQVIDPLEAAGKRCDERRATCWACIESIERAGVIRLPESDGG